MYVVAELVAGRIIGLSGFYREANAYDEAVAMASENGYGKHDELFEELKNNGCIERPGANAHDDYAVYVWFFNPIDRPVEEENVR